MEKTHTLLLTGATGFLGSNILRALLSSGYKVLATVRPTSSYHRISDLLDNPCFLRVDNEPESLEEAFRKNRIQAIIHTATEYGRGDVPLSGILDSNLILPIRLVELGIKYGVIGFINTDSFFNKPGKSYSNLLNYSLSKRTLLTWLMKFSEKISVANIVLEHLYGPGDSRTKFVEDTIQSIAIEQKKELKFTYGHQKRDFIYISDAVTAFLKVLEYMRSHAFNYKDFEVGFGHSIPVRDFVLEIARTSNSSTCLNFGALDYRDDEIMNSYADTRNIFDLGWRPSVSPSDGIRKIVETYRNSRDI